MYSTWLTFKAYATVQSNVSEIDFQSASFVLLTIVRSQVFTVKIRYCISKKKEKEKRASCQKNIDKQSTLLVICLGSHYVD